MTIILTGRSSEIGEGRRAARPQILLRNDEFAGQDYHELFRLLAPMVGEQKHLQYRGMRLTGAELLNVERVGLEVDKVSPEMSGEIHYGSLEAALRFALDVKRRTDEGARLISALVGIRRSCVESMSTNRDIGPDAFEEIWVVTKAADGSYGIMSAADRF